MFKRGTGIRRVGAFIYFKFKYPHWPASYAWHCAGYKPHKVI